MEFIEKLLDGVDGEWLTLGEVAEKIYSGGTPSTKIAGYWENGTIPWMSSGEVNLKLIEKTEQYITEAGFNNSSAKIVPKNSIVMALAGQGKTRGKVARTKIELTTNQSLAAITFDESRVNFDYVYHFLDSQYENLRQISSGNSGRGGLNLKIISNYKIPIPCPDNPKKSLEIQAEIVRILDAFTAMTAELTAELNLRRQQYNYYRDQLLSFEDGEVEWKTLGDVAIVQRGASPRPISKFITEDGEGVPWIKIGDTSPGSKYVSKTAQRITHEGAKKSRILDVGDFIISNSMSFGRPYILGIKGAIHDGWASISGFNETLNSDYLYHYLSSNNVQNYWDGKINSGSVSNLNANIIKTLPVPIPDFLRQKEIVAILDKFDTLTTSLTEGLPREIELRQKQYEYYRDLLLSFPKSEAA